ncbi:MAG: tetratricopeptide repeat protein, partial [Pseudomonadota bacterium]
MSKKVSSLLQQASGKLEKYDLGSAMNLYREALQLDPDNGAAAMGLAMVLNRNNQPGEALPILRRIWAALSILEPKASPEQMAAVLAQMGLAQQQLGQVADALESYRQAARLVSSEDLNRRIKQLEPLANSPVPVQQLILHARQLHQSRQLEEAVRTYRAALQLQADSAEALHGMALALRDLRSVDEALPLLQKATVLAPDRAEYFNDLGMLFQDKADYTKAISFHNRAIKLFPNFVWAYINLGVAHKRLGQHKEAVTAYVQALQINPNSPEAHNNLGNLCRLMGNYEKA